MVDRAFWPRVAFRTSLVCGLLGLLLAGSAAGQDTAREQDALIGVSGSIGGHEEAAEEIGSHETTSEEIQGREGRFEDIHRRESAEEGLGGHEEGAESLDPRIVDSEALEGIGHPTPSSHQQLEAAREQLRQARARHAQEQERALAAGLETPSTARDEEWLARLDVAKRRIEVARASARDLDTRYADMIRNDEPRGAERERLIADREAAKQRLASEQAMLPRLVDRARRDGVPQSMLSPYVETGSATGPQAD